MTIVFRQAYYFHVMRFILALLQVWKIRSFNWWYKHLKYLIWESVLKELNAILNHCIGFFGLNLLTVELSRKKTHTLSCSDTFALSWSQLSKRVAVNSPGSKWAGKEASFLHGFVPSVTNWGANDLLIFDDYLYTLTFVELIGVCTTSLRHNVR